MESNHEKTVKWLLSLAVCLSTGLLITGCCQTKDIYPRLESTLECCGNGIPPTIPICNEANVRLPERVKAYAVNRYIDPANPRIMHERHVLYRIEEDPAWRLATDESKQILIGNHLTDGKLNYNPVLMEKELAMELQRQRIINEALQTHSDMLIDTGAILSKDHEILLERSEKLRKALEAQGKIIMELKERLNLNL